MKLGVFTVPLGGLPLDEACAFLASHGVQMVEIGCGGCPGDAHCNAEELLQMDGVRVVIGVQQRARVVELTEQAVAQDRRINAVLPLKGAEFEALFVSRHEGKTRATMKIQEGCDRYCAYCIIPSVRGPVRSMPLENVRAEARRLAVTAQ